MSSEARFLLRRRMSSVRPCSLCARPFVLLTADLVVANPSEVPVVPSSAEDLAPLLRGLRENSPPLEDYVRFARGTIIRDRKVLDLCKQVVGPAGVGPLLSAMKEYDSITGLLLGNNITGSKVCSFLFIFIAGYAVVDLPLGCSGDCSLHPRPDEPYHHLVGLLFFLASFCSSKLMSFPGTLLAINSMLPISVLSPKHWRRTRR
jgi:hypothetical protein